MRGFFVRTWLFPALALTVAISANFPAKARADLSCDRELYHTSLPAGFKANRIQHVYWDWLSEGKRLMPQDDLSLMSRPLLRSDSGTSELCGSMCALHMVRMIRSLEGSADPFPSESAELENMARILWMKRIPIKEGLLPSDLAEVIKTMLGEGRVSEYLGPQIKDILMGDGVVRGADVIQTGETTATFVRVTAVNPHTHEMLGSHVMFEVGASPEKQELILLDPMDPEHPVQAKLNHDADRNGVGITFSKPLPFAVGEMYIQGVTTVELPKPTATRP